MSVTPTPKSSRPLRILLGVTLALAAGAAAVSQVFLSRPARVPPSKAISAATTLPGATNVERLGAIELVDRSHPMVSLAAVEPARLREHVRALYRVKPDRRFLRAVADVREVLTGEAKGTLA